MELELPKMLYCMPICLFTNALHLENSICDCNVAYKMYE